jgi:hypothetical protein
MNKRLIPKGGMTIYPNIRYIDGFDLDQQVKDEARQFFSGDREYQKLMEYKDYLNLDLLPIGKEYNVYVFKGEEKLGILRYIEYLNHPEGYGEGDFRIVKLIYPKYRRTKYSRYATGDLNHMLFYSGVANRCYAYQRSKTDDPSTISIYSFFITTSTAEPPPCSSPKLLANDGPAVQTHISVKKIIPADPGYYVVLYDIDGYKYRELDLKKYLTAPERKQEVVDRWIKEMNSAADLVRETANG